MAGAEEVAGNWQIAFASLTEVCHLCHLEVADV